MATSSMKVLLFAVLVVRLSRSWSDCKLRISTTVIPRLDTVFHLIVLLLWIWLNILALYYQRVVGIITWYACFVLAKGWASAGKPCKDLLCYVVILLYLSLVMSYGMHSLCLQIIHAGCVVFCQVWWRIMVGTQAKMLWGFLAGYWIKSWSWDLL